MCSGFVTDQRPFDFLLLVWTDCWINSRVADNLTWFRRIAKTQLAVKQRKKSKLRISNFLLMESIGVRTLLVDLYVTNVSHILIKAGIFSFRKIVWNDVTVICVASWVIPTLNLFDTLICVASYIIPV